MSKFLASRNGVLNNVIDNVFAAVKKDHRKLFWTAKADDENRAWHFERADGSFTRAGKSLFWYGIHDVKELERAIATFETKGRIERSYLPVGPSPPRGTRAYSTSAAVAGLSRRAFSSSPVASSSSSSSSSSAAPKRVVRPSL